MWVLGGGVDRRTYGAPPTTRGEPRKREALARGTARSVEPCRALYEVVLNQPTAPQNGAHHTAAVTIFLPS